ncbi:hypothetical protein [Streptomyces sp. NBC_01500]|uniref:hypothetical protein n=1 Tax=Streptomyces sp. NBC_01500 TaxID=2903886 RepID=UPI00224D9B60|nr:hypothetical protein [Streptomyces sp. NBC_01500]MCX4554591.1 hypothetical protein [Streptomyces sp. NBC_01500]
MRNLPRTHRVLTTQVNTDTTPAPNGRRVLVVGRFVRPTCDNCDGFESVKVVIGGELVTIDCTVCTAPTAGLDDVMDDIERQDDGRGFEAEDLLVAGRAA